MRDANVNHLLASAVAVLTNVRIFLRCCSKGNPGRLFPPQTHAAGSQAGLKSPRLKATKAPTYESKVRLILL